MRLRIGYVPLTDAAVLVAAAELGFAAREGVEIELERARSWASLRDKLALGHLDGAHILAPLALAAAAGLSGPRAALAAPFALNLNGNALTVSTELWAEMAGEGAGAGLDATARAFAAAALRRRAAGRALTLATVFPHSTHTYQLRLFCERGGLPMEEAARIIVVPPPAMVEALRTGAIDGFCVGSPWNGVAVAAGLGRVAALGVEIMPDAPEKVLALHEGFARGAPTLALLRALQAAADWCADPANRPDLARRLAAPRHLDLDVDPILRSLEGRVLAAPDGTERDHPRYLVFGGASTRPDAGHARWIEERLGLEAGGPAGRVYRPDLHDAALGGR
jgi:NitT/TauT family transport system ATP-binding protein